MPVDFDSAERLFREDRIPELSRTPDGLLYLKLKSLSRRQYLERLIEKIGLAPRGHRVAEMFREVCEFDVNVEDVDALIQEIYAEERSERKRLEDDLTSELYRLQVFDWGGLRQGALERTIVDNYVKRIRRYDDLCDRIENELQASLTGYVLCSWYNHWTSIIIEDVFRDHPRTLPAVGRVKKVDFFPNDVPFDLKVTYLPEEYIAERRRSQDLRPEITVLKALARQFEVSYDQAMPKKRLLQDLWLKLADHPSEQVAQVLGETKSMRDRVLDQTLAEPADLIKWLYEKQGARRFDAANRLFLILVDRSNYFDSWKLKRARPLLVDRIHRYLDQIGPSPGRQIEFRWTDGHVYKVVSDAVFVIHDRGTTQ